MHLLYRWIGTSKGWKATTLKKEQTEIACFYDLEEAKNDWPVEKLFCVALSYLDCLMVFYEKKQEKR